MKARLSHRHFAYGLITLFALELCLLVVSIYAMARFASIESAKPEQIGVTFSQVQAERFGSDWRANYVALLNDLHFKHIRIIAYWDRVEISPNQFNFSELDWMVETAKQYNAQVTIALGQRVLRYPECFYPSWLNKNDSNSVATSITPYLKAVAGHYQGNNVVSAWQLENEFLLDAFGECPKGNMTKQALSNELKALQSVDSTRPIVLTASDEYGLPITGPLASDYGFSMYKTVWNQITKNGYFTYIQPGMYNWWRASLVSLFGGQNIRVHELQAEPWGPVGNEKLSLSEAAKSMNPAKLRANVDYARSTHIRHIDLWGAEWWYWMKTAKNDDSMWEAVREFSQ